MSLSVKFSDIVPSYSGDSDFCEWLKKLTLVAKLQKVKDLSAFLPLFLTGGAFAVYEGLTEETQTDFEKLSEALKAAFSPNKFDAFEQFMARRLLPGENIDVYVADLKRLAGIVNTDVPEDWIQCALVRGLPEAIQQQLRASCKLNDMSFIETVERCRLLVTLMGSANFGMAAISNGRDREPLEKRKCFVCGVVGHLSRFCPSKASREEKRKCYLCATEGHIVANCPNRPKNE